MTGQEYLLVAQEETAYHALSASAGSAVAVGRISRSGGCDSSTIYQLSLALSEVYEILTCKKTWNRDDSMVLVLVALQ
jgi:hypothetical protein